MSPGRYAFGLAVLAMLIVQAYGALALVESQTTVAAKSTASTQAAGQQKGTASQSEDSLRAIKQVGLGEKFTLAINEMAQVKGTGLKLTMEGLSWPLRDATKISVAPCRGVAYPGCQEIEPGTKAIISIWDSTKSPFAPEGRGPENRGTMSGLFEEGSSTDYFGAYKMTVVRMQHDETSFPYYSVVLMVEKTGKEPIPDLSYTTTIYMGWNLYSSPGSGGTGTTDCDTGGWKYFEYNREKNSYELLGPNTSKQVGKAYWLYNPTRTCTIISSGVTPLTHISDCEIGRRICMMRQAGSGSP